MNGSSRELPAMSLFSYSPAGTARSAADAVPGCPAGIGEEGRSVNTARSKKDRGGGRRRQRRRRRRRRRH
eukprot:765497-Hanusia_phi.AAC.8